MLIIFKHCHTDSKEDTKQYFVLRFLMLIYSLAIMDFYYDNWSILYPLFPESYLEWNFWVVTHKAWITLQIIPIKLNIP